MRIFDYKILADHGATASQIAIFKALVANDTLWGKNETSLYQRLSENLLQVPSDENNRLSIHRDVVLPDKAHNSRFNDLALQSSKIQAREWEDLFPQLIKCIQEFSERPSEISALRLYRAFDFEDILAPNHCPNEGYSDHFFKPLKAATFDKAAFHAFAVFVGFNSGNAHIIQNVLMALTVCPGAIPFILLDVLGRYEPYNLVSFELIRKVPNVTDTEREDLTFTHFRSMDSGFYFEKMECIEATSNTTMKRWAALNTTSEFAAQYYSDEFFSQTPNSAELLAAFDHYIWCASQLMTNFEVPEIRQTVARSLEPEYLIYLYENLEQLTATDCHACWIGSRSASLYHKIMSDNWQTDTPGIHARARDLHKAIATRLAAPDFDDILTRLTPDLASESSSYFSLVRPPSHSYGIFIDAKSIGSDIWFPRELERVKSGDMSNWGTLEIVLKTSTQFNVLSAWLLDEIKDQSLPDLRGHLFGVPMTDFVHRCLKLYPFSANLLLHGRKLMVLILRSKQTKLRSRVLRILYKNQSAGYDVPPEFIHMLKGLDPKSISVLDKWHWEKILLV